MNANTAQHPTRITVRDLRVGDEIVYLDGNQKVARIEETIDLDFRTMFAIYAEGVDTPRLSPGRAPITVLR